MEKITKELIKELFKKYNTLYFDNELRLPRFTTYKGRRTYGVYSYKIDKKTKKPKNERFAIANNVNWSEDTLRNIIVHEMIHCYIAQKNIKDNRDHGKVFKQMMNDYNRHYGLNITVKIDNKRLPFTDQKPRTSLTQKLIKCFKKIVG